MAPRDKKILLITLGLLVGSYVFHDLVFSVLQVVYRPPRQAPRPAPPAAKPETVSQAPAAAPVSAPPSAPKPGGIAGIWRGTGIPMEGRGYCNLRLELQEKDSGSYTGYSSFSCINNGLTPKDKKALILNPHPDDAVLTGTTENGVIRFAVDKNIGTDFRGCAISGLTLTPFSGQFAAEWEYGACPGGHVLLKRAPR